jgi:flagellar assembly protein FliH
MSDPVILPVNLSEARSHAGGFHPRSALGFALPTRHNEQSGEDIYARGLADGQDIAQAAFAVERIHYQALITSAHALQNEPSDELAALIAETVERLVRECVGATPIDTQHLNKQAASAAALIGECDEARTMWVHPDDLLLLDQGMLPIAVMADPAALRGSIRINCSAGWIEHGVPLYLSELRAALGITERGA